MTVDAHVTRRCCGQIRGVWVEIVKKAVVLHTVGLPKPYTLNLEPFEP